MARPKLPNGIKKERLSLTVSREVKEMADVLRKQKNISISELVEDFIRKEFKKIETK